MSRDVEILADPADEPGLVDEWRALAEAAGNAFTTPEWYGAYARHYGADAPPFVVRVRDADGSLAGLLPLCRSGRTVRFAGANVGDRFAPVAVAGREAEVARAAAGALGREAVVLHNVDAGAPWIGALGEGLRGRVAATRLRGSVMPYVPLTGHTWDTFLGARSRNFRSQVRRKERALVDGEGAKFRATAVPGEVRRRRRRVLPPAQLALGRARGRLDDHQPDRARVPRGLRRGRAGAGVAADVVPRGAGRRE